MTTTEPDTRRWRSIDAPPPIDERVVEDATEIADDLGQALAHEGKRLARALANARLWADTGVRAASTSDAGPTLVCTTHDRNLTRCLEQDLDCTGEYRTRSDPAGQAAVELDRDQARRDHAELLALTRQLGRFTRLVDRYQTRPGTGSPGPDIDWCRSCHRNDRHHQPIDRRRDGTPYYAGLCRWCGAFKGEHRIEPPIELLRARHLGQRITTRMVSTALAAARAKGQKVRR